MMPVGFDKIASIYDRLAWLVFGDAIQQAQEHFLDDVPPQSKVLILGGGTGVLLVKLLKSKPACEVWYVESSEKMLRLSEEKTNHSDNVHFIHGTENAIPSEIQFDVVITNFYLDLFTEASLDSVIQKTQNTLKPDAMWAITDFVDRKIWWQSVLLKIMYPFFRIVCGIEATCLPDWNQQLVKGNFFKLKSKYFYRGFIETAVYHYPH